MSWRWWFEDRLTGRITIAQFPNWPLIAVAGVWVLARFTEPGTWVDDALLWATRVLWFWWGNGELVSGVNPWRRHRPGGWTGEISSSIVGRPPERASPARRAIGPDGP